MSMPVNTSNNSGKKSSKKSSKKEKKSKKAPNVVIKQEEEEDYSIAALLRKKQQQQEAEESESHHNNSGGLKSTGSSYYDDEDDVSANAAIDAVLAHTENMRRDTIATVAASASPERALRPVVAVGEEKEDRLMTLNESEKPKSVESKAKKPKTKSKTTRVVPVSKTTTKESKKRTPGLSIAMESTSTHNNTSETAIVEEAESLLLEEHDPEDDMVWDLPQRDPDQYNIDIHRSKNKDSSVNDTNHHGSLNGNDTNDPKVITNRHNVTLPLSSTTAMTDDPMDEMNHRCSPDNNVVTIDVHCQPDNDPRPFVTYQPTTMSSSASGTILLDCDDRSNDGKEIIKNDDCDEKSEIDVHHQYLEHDTGDDGSGTEILEPQGVKSSNDNHDGSIGDGNDKEENDDDKNVVEDDVESSAPRKPAASGGWWSNVVSRVLTTKSPTKQSSQRNPTPTRIESPSSPNPMATAAAASIPPTPTTEEQPEQESSLSPSPELTSTPKRFTSSAFQLLTGVVGRQPKTAEQKEKPLNTSSDCSISNFDHESDEEDDEENQMSQEPKVHYDDMEYADGKRNDSADSNEDFETSSNPNEKSNNDEGREEEQEDDDDDKIIDELSSYHDEDDDLFDNGEYDINENDYDDEQYNHKRYMDEHGNFYSRNNDEEYYDDNYNHGLYNNNQYPHGYDENDNDTLTDHDLEYSANYIHASNNHEGMMYDNTTQMEKSYQERQRRKRIRKAIIYGLVLCCCLMLAAVILVVVFVVILPSKNDDNSDVPSSTNDGICAPFESSIGEAELCTILTNAIVPVHPNRTLSNLYNSVPTSCQFLTLEWMIGTISGDLKIVRDINRIRQRYGYGVFHCEIYTPSWFTLDLHLVGDNNECKWSTNDLTDEITDFTTSPCNGNNELLIVRIINDDSNSTIEPLQFGGTLPPELSMITTLQEITLTDHSSNLFGTIPSEYAELTKLEALQLSSNTLNGTIPSFVYNIVFVDLSNNTLTGTIPARSTTSTGSTTSATSRTTDTTTAFKNIFQTTTSSSSLPKPSDTDTYSTANDYYFTRHRTLQDQTETAISGIPKSLLLHKNQLSGKLSLVDILRPGMEEFTVHTNKLTGTVVQPLLDQSKNLKRLTMYDNNVTGNVNVLCPLSSSEGGILTTFVVDVGEVVCSCCTGGDQIDENGDGFGNISPTISIPKIPPPTMAPKVTSTPTTIRPTVLVTVSPTNDTGASVASSAPSVMPSSLSGTIIIDPTPTNSTNIATKAPTLGPVSLPVNSGINDTTAPIDSNFTTRKPFLYFTTTKMESYNSQQQPFDCNFTDNVQPHVLTQCRCYNTIQVLTDDIVDLYARVRDTIYSEVYSSKNLTDQFVNETIDSCSAQNQALVWLSSGNLRDGGDLYQRYVLALLYFQMNGAAWLNSSSWLSYHNECDWHGIDCRSTTADGSNLQVRSIQLDDNNVQNTIPNEIRYLSTLQIISFRNNQLSGTIPASITTQGFPYIQGIIFSNNSLTGTIPSLRVSSMTVPSYLESFQLDTNFMLGTIPDWFLTTSLKTLSLHSNIFSGTIPSSIGSHNNSALQYLYLHNNQLSGMCHVCICSLPVLLYGVTFILHNTVNHFVSTFEPQRSNPPFSHFQSSRNKQQVQYRRRLGN